MRTLPALCLALFGTIPSAHAAPINVGNLIWEDRDADGVQDGGEPGFAGVTVQLWNGAKNQLLDSDTTNASGAYALTAPEPGDYRVRVLLPTADATFSPKDAGGSDLLDSDVNPTGTHFGFTDTYVISPAVVSVTSLDAGIVLPHPIAVGDLIFDDTDGDGIQDAGDAGIAGVTVQLWNSAKNQLFASSTTNAEGIYSLTAPEPGSYRVRVLLPAGATSFSPKDAGANDQLDSDVNPAGMDFGFTDPYVFDTALDSINSIDTGVIFPRPIRIGNFVWDDIDRDGLQDAGEPGVEGIRVQLWNAARNDLIDSVITNASGNYSLIAPGAGDYRVRVLLPATDFSFSPKNQGGDSVDSDVNPIGTDFGFTDPYTYSAGVASTTNVDAGLLGPQLFGDGFE
jgi:hypothetical protein